MYWKWLSSSIKPASSDRFIMQYLCLQFEYFCPVFPIPTVVCTCRWRFPSFLLFPFWTLMSGIARHFWVVLTKRGGLLFYATSSSGKKLTGRAQKLLAFLCNKVDIPVGVVGSEVAWLRRAASACPWFISLRIELSSWSAAFDDRAGELAELDIILAADSTRESPKNGSKPVYFVKRVTPATSSCATRHAPFSWRIAADWHNIQKGEWGGETLLLRTVYWIGSLCKNQKNHEIYFSQNLIFFNIFKSRLLPQVCFKIIHRPYYEKHGAVWGCV